MCPVPMHSAQSNFDAAYAGNRAPLPIFVHEPWLKVRAPSLSMQLHFCRRQAQGRAVALSCKPERRQAAAR